MSVANILGADGKISAAYLPTGTANNYVDNPMTEPLDGGGFSMVDINDIQAKGYTVLNSSGVAQAQFTFGTDEDGDTGVLLKATNPALDTNLIVDGVIKGAGLSGNSVNVGTYVNIPAGIASGLSFSSPMNQLKVSYTDGVGLGLTAAGGTANFAAEDITATGEVDSASVKTSRLTMLADVGQVSLSSGSGSVAYPSIALTDRIFLQGTNTSASPITYRAQINLGVGFTVISTEAGDNSGVNYMIVHTV